jgi:hypothetical protein
MADLTMKTKCGYQDCNNFGKCGPCDGKLFYRPGKNLNTWIPDPHLGPCSKCGDYVKPCRCSLEAEVKALKAELNDKCLLCEASTDARSWQAENEALRQAAGELVEAVEDADFTRSPLLAEYHGIAAAAASLRQLIKGSK